jgi:ABC-2 type transport system permease protein
MTTVTTPGMPRSQSWNASGLLRIAVRSARMGFENIKTEYTWKSWAFGWMLRSVSQVVFFSAMGLMLGGHTFVLYAMVGNIAAMAAFSPLGTSSETAWERGVGTMPLLVAAPRSLLPVFAGRSAFLVLQGFGEACLIFALVAPFTGISGRWWWFPVGLAVVAIGAYGLGLFMASIAIRRLRIGDVQFNVVFYTLVTLAGVNIDPTRLPVWVQRVADFLPLKHGLAGLRELFAHGASVTAFQQLGLELMVGLGWSVVAMVGFWWFAQGGRRDGSIDLVV